MHASGQVLQGDLCLTATAEVPMAGMFAHRVLPVETLPQRFVAFNHAFRTEVMQKLC